MSLSDNWWRTAKDCERTIVIAPELDDQLATVVRQLRSMGVDVCISNDTFLKAASDKLQTARYIEASLLQTPLTRTLEQFLNSEPDPILQSGVLTLKRRDGAGCAGMKLFDDANSLRDWTNVHPEIHDLNSWLVQPWLAGTAASTALVVHTDQRLEWLGAVTQAIELVPDADNPSIRHVEYRGGIGPLIGINDKVLIDFASAAIAAIPGEARGWIGIDFLYEESAESMQDLTLIEINPRLTTSYLGYREWYGPSLANQLVSNELSASLSPLSHRPAVRFCS